MKKNNEVTIAILVALVMVLFCVILFIGNKSNVKAEDIVMSVYIYDAEREGYLECPLSTEDKLKINKQLSKVKNKKIEDSISGTKINGDYKIVLNNDNNNFYAFDKKHNNRIFIGDQNRLYPFSSEIYEIVFKTCE